MNYDSVHNISYRLAKQISLGTNSSPDTVLEILKDLIRSSQGQAVETGGILGSVTKLTHVNDIRVKRLVYLYLSFITEDDSELWLHVMNSISINLADPNPFIRKSALLLLTDSLSISSALNDARVDHVEKMLKDANPSVRKCAVAGVSKLSLLFDVRKIELDMSTCLEKVSKMIYADDDPSVIVECIHCLRTCKKQCIKPELLLSLLERLDMVDIWTKTEIINLFTQISDPYKMSKEEIFKALNLLDPFLDPKFLVPLSLSCITAMLFVSKRFSNIHSDVKSRVLDHILCQLTMLRPPMKPLYYSVMDTIADKALYSKLVPFYKHFIPLPCDDSFLKLKKLKLLQKSCSEQNCEFIFKIATSIAMVSREDELALHASNVLITLHSTLPTQSETFFVRNLKNKSSTIVSVAVLKLWEICFLKSSQNSLNPDSIIDEMVVIYEKLSTFEAKSAYLSFMCAYPKKQHVRTLGDILTSEIDSWSSITSAMFKLSLIRTSVTFYFLAPVLYQKILSKLLLLASKDDNILVNKHALMYYNLLKQNPDAAKTFVTEVNQLNHCDEMQSSLSENIERLKSLSLLHCT